MSRFWNLALISALAAALLASTVPVSGHHTSKVDNRWVHPYGIQVFFHVPVAAGYEPLPTPQHCRPGVGLSGVFYAEDFEGAHGYQFVGTPLAGGVANLWRTTTYGGVGSDSGHSGPARLYYGNPSTGTYNAGHTAGAAQSPLIALPASGSVHLSFATKWQVEWLKGYDHLWVEALDVDTGRTHLLCTANAYDRGDPAGVAGNTIVSSCSPYHFTPCPNVGLGWETRTIDVPGALQGHTIRLRFTFDSADDKANPYLGWMVDDVRLGTGLVA